MRSIAERHKFIVDQLNKNGFIRVQDIADQLGVTGATIRKDLRVLEGQNILYRTHGSASPVKPQVIDLSVNQKISQHIEIKKRIADAAQTLITSLDSIILASGSTVTVFADRLQPIESINVVTPSLGIAVALYEKQNVKVYVLGGALIRNSLSVRDSYSVEGLKYVSCSKLFFGCEGFDFEAGITCATVEEAELTSAMMRASAKTVVLADSSKFARRGFGKICNMEDIDILITDDGIPASSKQKLEDLGVQLILV